MPVVVVRSKVLKAQDPITVFSDRSISRVSRAFLAAVDSAARGITLKGLASKIETNNGAEVDRYINIESRMQEAAKGSGLLPSQESLIEALRYVYEGGAKIGVDGLGQIQVTKISVGAAMSFDLLNPQAVSFLQSYTFNLIVQASKETRLAIQSAILDAFKNGGHPYDQARKIQQSIGLTRIQQQAVVNFRKALENGAFNQALNRSIRDGRFDKTLQNALKNKSRLKPEQIDRMVDQYAKRYLAYRAKAIARTETIKASNAGQLESWHQAASQGYLKPDTKRKWLVSADERTCDECNEIARLNSKGVGLSEYFITPSGTKIPGPPAHTFCRCGQGLIL